MHFLQIFKSFVCKASVLTYKNINIIINITVFSNCIHCTVKSCLQLLYILIVSLLMLHINIVGVVTGSDSSIGRLVARIIGFFFQFILLSHYTVPLLKRQHHNTRKKTKSEQNAINSCHVVQFHVLQFHALQVGPSIIISAFPPP